MKNKILIITFTILSLFIFNFAYADTNIHLQIKTTTDLFNQTITVASCDSDNDIVTPDLTTPYCAIKNKTSLQNDWSFGEFGAFLNSLNNISGSTTKDKDGNPVYHYWSWSLNNEMAMEALNVYQLKENDSILLEFIDPQEPTPLPEVLKEPTHISHSSGGSYVTQVKKVVFDVNKAIEFLLLNQKKDGSFASPMYTDWVAIALGAIDNSTLKSNILNYLKSNPIQSSLLTDYERRAMALLALGVNPYDGTEVNYIKKIIESFDGVQFGDATMINDDIFALVVLQNAGYHINDEIIKKDVTYIISKQEKNGGWGSVDMTSAAIMSIKEFKDISGTSESLKNAENYLIGEKKSDGGFSNSFSTSWVLQSLSDDSRFINAEEYLIKNQQADGGFEDVSSDINTRVWATAYVLPAILHKSWNDILVDFPKQVEKEKTDKIIESIFIPSSLEVVIKKTPRNNSNLTITKTPVIIEIIENQNQNQNQKENQNIFKIKEVSNFKRTWKAIKSPFVWLWYRL